MTAPRWAGRIVTQARDLIAATLPTNCPRCGHPVHPDHDWHVDHIPGRDQLDPADWLNPDYLHAAHATCNTRAGARYGNRKRAAARSPVEAQLVRGVPGVPGRAETRPLVPLLPFSEASSDSPGSPLPQKTPRVTKAATESDGQGLEVHADGFTMPRIWTPEPGPHDYSMADACLAWIAGPDCPGPPLEPWQRFVAREALAMRDGELVHPVVVLRVSRQQGKTYLVRRVLLWLLLHGGDWLGGPRRVVNTHPDGIQAVALMEPMARQLGWGRRGMPGLESQVFMAMWHPGGAEDEAAPAWFARAMTVRALTGLPGITTAFVDEVQDAKTDPVQEGLFGAMSSRRVRNRQRWLAGTGEKPGSVMLRGLKRRIGAPGVLWAEWSMPPGVDPRDEAHWRWGSPEWDRHRLAFLREQAAELDAAAFRRNYLLSDEVDPVEGLLDRWTWAELEGVAVGRPVAAAVEARPDGQPVVAVVSAAVGGGRLVGVRQASSMQEAADWCRGLPVVVGKSLLRDPVWAASGAVPGQGTGAAACGRLLLLVRAGGFAHDGGPLLGGQVAGTTVVSNSSGLRVTSSGRVDAVKAAVWAMDLAAELAASPPQIW